MQTEFRFGWTSVVVAALLLLPLTAQSADRTPPRDVRDIYGPLFQKHARSGTQRERIWRRSSAAADAFRYWNAVSVDASGLDHTPPGPGETRQFAEQLGPGRASRAIAIVHIAIFDAVNAIAGGYESYTRIWPAPRGSSIEAAIAQAAHDTLVKVFPAQSAAFDELLRFDLESVSTRDPRAKQSGIDVGRRAAAAILALRAGDLNMPDPKVGIDYFTNDAPGHWRQDPIGKAPIAMGAEWSRMKPFVIQSATQFRAPPPPPMDSLEYAAAFEEVKALGGDGVHTSTQRTADQTETGIFWAYDGTPSLCAPPRLYNQILLEITKRSSNVVSLARLFALANIAMADAGIAIWESKFTYDFWRPVTGIREADEGTGPSGGGDGNPQTVGLEFWPLGAPASNLAGPNFTPPFPSYPSGHAGFGGALFQTIREYYGTDRIPFTFISDEFNGETVGNDGQVRPFASRSYTSLSQAEEENGQSRIYLGIHWSFDKTAGIEQGRRVAHYVFQNALRPKRR